MKAFLKNLSERQDAASNFDWPRSDTNALAIKYILKLSSNTIDDYVHLFI